VLDTETTGLEAHAGDRVCEIAVVRAHLDPRRPSESWSSLVAPGRPMPATAESIHGISDADLAGAPSWADVHAEVTRQLDGAVLVAHNAAFDVGFLAAEAARLGLPSPVRGPVLCTLTLARRVYGFHACSLRALARRASVPQPLAHRALADVQTTLGVLRALIDGLSPGGSAPRLGPLLTRIDDMRRDGPGRQAIEDAIRRALAEGRPVTIDYTARFGTDSLTTRRTVTPERLRRGMLDGWCHLRGAHRTFHLKRIQRVLDG
jgi:DNA polymerase III epsilon subunit family exonuclease